MPRIRLTQFPAFRNTRQCGGWNTSSEVHAHSFGTSIDYLRGYTDGGNRRWTRQIVFLKGKAASGPNYFIFRDSNDSLKGDPKKLPQWWWNFRTVGSKDQVVPAANDLNYTSKFGPQLNVHFLQPSAIQAKTRDIIREVNSVLAHVDTWRTNGECKSLHARA